MYVETISKLQQTIIILRQPTGSGLTLPVTSQRSEEAHLSLRKSIGGKSADAIEVASDITSVLLKKAKGVPRSMNEFRTLYASGLSSEDRWMEMV